MSVSIRPAVFDMKLDVCSLAGSGFPLGALAGIIPAAIVVLAIMAFLAVHRRRRKTRLQNQANGPVRSPWDRAAHHDQRVRCHLKIMVMLLLLCTSQICRASAGPVHGCMLGMYGQRQRQANSGKD